MQYLQFNEVLQFPERVRSNNRDVVRPQIADIIKNTDFRTKFKHKRGIVEVNAVTLGHQQTRTSIGCVGRPCEFDVNYSSM